MTVLLAAMVWGTALQAEAASAAGGTGTATPPPAAMAGAPAGFVVGSSRELVQERTEFTALFANPDGSKTVRSSTSPLHYRAGLAAWEQIDTAVVADGGAPGVLRTKANAWTARFRPLPGGVEFDTSEGRLSFSPLGAAAVAPQVTGDGSVVVYPEAWPGVDLRYEVTPTEVKEDLILNRRPATAMFEFSTGGTEFDATPEGGLVPRGRDPKKGRLARPEVTDMKGTELTAAKPTMRTVKEGGGKIQLKIDERFLADTPDSAFPIILDPTVQLGSGNMQNYKTYPNGAVASCTSACQLRVGNTVEPWNGALTDAYWRSVGYFDYSAAFGASVSDVWLDLARSPGEGTAAAHANNVKVFLPGAYSWPGATSGGVLLAQGTVGENTGYQPLRGAAMTNQIAAWARDRVWGGSLGFTGLEQPGLYTYKKFSIFNLNVTYAATPPATPASLTATAQRDGSAVLSYPAATPDGGGGTVRYEVKAFTSSGQSGGTFNTTSAAPITWNGLVDGTTYWFTVQAFNSIGGSGVRTSPQVLATRYAAAPPNVKVWPGNATAWVTWGAADARGGPPITGYEVYLCKVDGSGCYGPTTVANVFGRAKVTPPGIINGVPYLAVVRALTARGIGDNGLSQNVTLSASAAPFPVQYVSASAGSGTRTWISWTSPEANGTAPVSRYIVWRLVNGVHTQYWDNIPATAPAGGTIGSFEASDLTDTRPSTYEIYPVNANGYVGAPGPGPATSAVTPAANAAPYTPQRPEGSHDVVNRPSLQAADGQVLVRWSPPAPNGATSSCGNPTKYAVYLLDGVGVPWLSQEVTGTGAVFTTTPAGAGQPGIINGHTYLGVVYALNDSGSCANNGWSGPSYTDYGTPMSGLGDLVTPTQVAASGGDQKATVSWHKPFYGIDGLTTYTITATPDPANNPSPPVGPIPFTTGPMSGGSTLTHDIGGLRNGTTYTFTVRANLLFLFANPDSAPSNPVTPAGVPFAPVITEAAAGNQSATVSWQPPTARDGIPGDNGAAITTYTVVPTPACPRCTGTTTSGATSTTVTGLTNGTSYTFTVFATNIVGPGAASAASEQPVTPAGKPFSPTGASASWAGTEAANVSWQAPQASGVPGDNGAPIVSYTVVPTPECPTCRDTTTPGATSTTVTGLQPETTYSFTVIAANSYGTSDASPSSNQIIPPLAPVDPRGGSVDVPRGPSLASAAGLQPPVTPTPLAPQVRPASELVDAATSNAKAILGRAGRLTTSGDPDLAAGNLQPQVDSAEFFDPTRATLEQLTAALTGSNLPPTLPIDPLALLEELPDGLLPSLTYRVCSESKTKAASCSLTLPLAIPAVVDATGDGTPDVLVDVLPSISTADVIGRVREILDLQALLDGGSDVQAELDEKTAALLGIVNVGLALLSVRLPTSETSGGPLPAHVWAVYELAGDKRLSVGFDGFRRGDTLPQSALGTFTFNPGSAAQGILDVRGAMVQDGAGSSLALTLGTASVVDDHPVDPTVASAQFSPVPSAFDAHAVVDVAGERASVDATTNIPTRLDAIVLTNRLPASGGFDRFTQLVVDQFPTTVAATVSRRPGDGRTTLDYTASSPVASIGVADLEYRGTTLNRAITASASNLPARFSTSLTTVPDGITLDYTAASRISALEFGFYDRTFVTTVGTASATDLPTALKLAADLPTRRLTSEAAEGIGSLSGVFSRNGAPFAPLADDHASLITVGQALGLSGRLTGLRKIDLIADAHPRLAATFEPGGQAFTAAGSIDGVDLARIDISNLPATLSVDLDPAARTVAYRGTAPIPKLRAAYNRTTTGPTLVLGLEEVPTSLDASYGLGDQPRAHVESSSPIRRVELFASPDPIQTLDRESSSFLSLAATDVPITVDLKVDIPTRHAEGRFSAPVGTVTAVARSPFAGRIFHAAAELTGIPAQFNADFAEGTYRFEGSGPITSAALAVTNHPNATAPVGQHLAAHYHQANGDFDASASIRNLSLAEYARTATNQTFTVNADTGGQPVFIDADVVLTAGGVADTRLAALGRVDGLPNVIRAGLVNGTLSYSADQPTALKAQVHVGKINALNGLATPLLENGVALAAKGCDSGPGCATDDTPLCTILSRCLGLVGTVNLSGLPTTVALDPAARTVRVTGYQPPATVPLQAYLDVDGLIGSMPRLQALATLAGLPSPLDLTIGPFSFDSDSSTKLNVGYQASAPLGSLQVQAAAKTTAYGDVRGRVNLSPLPMTLNATAEFGSITRLAVNASAPLAVLTAQVTGLFQGAPASAQADLRQIPARLSLEATGFSKASLGLPKITYDADASTLDGNLNVEARLVEAFKVSGVNIPIAGEVYARFTDLGEKTTVTFNPDNSVEAVSVPGTASLGLDGTIDTSVANIPVDVDPLFEKLGFTGSLKGHVGASRVHIGRLSVAIDGLRSLDILPSPKVSFLTTGFSGNYNRLSIDVADIDIRPDVVLDLKVTSPDPIPDYNRRIGLPDFTGINFHLYDEQLRPSTQIHLNGPFGATLACLEIATRPGPIATGANHIDVYGTNGPQTLSLLDPIPFPVGVEPAIVSLGIDLVTAYVATPFEAGEVTYEPEFGEC